MDCKEDIYHLIEKQFAGKLSDTEKQYLKEWYNSNSENRRQYENYYILLKHLRITRNEKQFKPYTTGAYQRFLGKTERLTLKRRNKELFRLWLRYAAIFIIAFGLGISFYYLFQSDSSADKLTQTIEIPFGSKSKITLPDGTSVWLNSGSILSYSESFGKKDRTVTLDGEGFFDVSRNESLPFYVLSGRVKVKVLGTKFNFKSYREDENARVTLVEGSLNVADINSKSQPTLLSPNQQAVIDKKNDQLTVKNVEAGNYTIWTELKSETIDITENRTTGDMEASVRTPNVTLRNILFFDEEPLSQIVRDLERVYNIKIEIQDSVLKSERFYGDFRNEETLTEILEIMARNNNLTYSIQNDEIIIARK